MDDLILSYTVLEFFCWNPNWDIYLTKLIKERQKKHEQKKEVIKS